MLYRTILYWTLLYCTVLYCIGLYCAILYCTVLYRTILYSTILYCILQYYTVLCCATEDMCSHIFNVDERWNLLHDQKNLLRSRGFFIDNIYWMDDTYICVHSQKVKWKVDRDWMNKGILKEGRIGDGMKGWHNQRNYKRETQINFLFLLPLFLSILQCLGLLCASCLALWTKKKYLTKNSK